MTFEEFKEYARVYWDLASPDKASCGAGISGAKSWWGLLEALRAKAVNLYETQSPAEQQDLVFEEWAGFIQEKIRELNNNDL